RAAAACAWLKEMLDSGEVFHPLRWLPREALRLLRDVPRLQEAGIAVRMPAAWAGNRPPRPQVTATIGGRAPSVVGRDALLDGDDIGNGAGGPEGGGGDDADGPAGGGLAGGGLAGAGAVGGDGADWSRVVAGPWLSETLKGLRSPQGLARVDPGAVLRGTL